MFNRWKKILDILCNVDASFPRAVQTYRSTMKKVYAKGPLRGCFFSSKESYLKVINRGGKDGLLPITFPLSYDSGIGQHALSRVLMPYYRIPRLMDHSVMQAVFCHTRSAKMHGIIRLRNTLNSHVYSKEYGKKALIFT